MNREQGRARGAGGGYQPARARLVKTQLRKCVPDAGEREQLAGQPCVGGLPQRKAMQRATRRRSGVCRRRDHRGPCDHHAIDPQQPVEQRLGTHDQRGTR